MCSAGTCIDYVPPVMDSGVVIDAGATDAFMRVDQGQVSHFPDANVDLGCGFSGDCADAGAADGGMDAATSMDMGTTTPMDMGPHMFPDLGT